MGFFSKNPAKAAQPYLSSIPGQISPYYQPYIDQGRQSMGTLNTQYGRMLNNPGDIVNELGSGFQESPGYQWDLNQGTEAANNAAAAGGYVGTPMHQQNEAEMAEGVANKYYQPYMQETMHLYDQGIKGNQQFNQQGFNASSDMASAIAQALVQQANLAYSGASNQNQSRRGLLGGAVGAGLRGYGTYEGAKAATAAAPMFFM